jgi:hypothetical protein
VKRIGNGEKRVEIDATSFGAGDCQFCQGGIRRRRDRQRCGSRVLELALGERAELDIAIGDRAGFVFTGLGDVYRGNTPAGSVALGQRRIGADQRGERPRSVPMCAPARVC